MWMKETSQKGERAMKNIINLTIEPLEERIAPVPLQAFLLPAIQPADSYSNFNDFYSSPEAAPVTGELTQEIQDANDQLAADLAAAGGDQQEIDEAYAEYNESLSEANQEFSEEMKDAYADWLENFEQVPQAGPAGSFTR